MHGTLKGQGYSTVIVDYVQNEQKVEPGEWFYTSGDDRIFPKGLPVGEVTVVRHGQNATRRFTSRPAGLQNGLEEVLIVVEGVHRDRFRKRQPALSRCICWIAPPAGVTATDAAPVHIGPAAATDADRLVDRYRKIGEAREARLRQSAERTAPESSTSTLNARRSAPSSARCAGSAPASGSTRRAAGRPRQSPDEASMTDREPISAPNSPKRPSRRAYSQLTRALTIAGIPLAAILFQVYVPR